VIKAVNDNSDSTTNDGQSYAVKREYVDRLIDMVKAIKTGKWSSDPDGAGDGRSCSVCNESSLFVKCRGESHPLCADCVNDAVVHAPASTTVDFQLACLIDGCSSQPFAFKDL
jgi:hypothetical protein